VPGRRGGTDPKTPESSFAIFHPCRGFPIKVKSRFLSRFEPTFGINARLG
jgi:hypothetical protein